MDISPITSKFVAAEIGGLYSAAGFTATSRRGVDGQSKADCLLPLQRGQEKAMLHALRVSLFVVLLSALPAAAETWTDAALIAALREGGNVIVLQP